VRSLVLTLAQADRLGMSLGPLLRAQSAQQRSERFLRAEKLALEAPVRMLFPMVLCIFPCTFLVIGFPVAVKLLQSGL
jgi:tight adherence protein C